MTTLHTLYTLLRDHFGPLTGPEASRPWWPIFGPDPLVEILVGAILVQQTRWETVEGAVLRLREAGLLSIPALAQAEPGALATLIRPAAFHTQKAPGLVAIAGYVQQHYAGSLATMLAQPSAALRRELLSLPRVGPETADVIMLYGGNHPVFVVDAYTRRLFGRVLNGDGAIDKEESFAWERAPYETVRQHIERELEITPSTPHPLTGSATHPHTALYADYHAQINEACVRYCLSTPRCDGPPARRVYSLQQGRESYLASHEGCPLRSICRYYQGSRSITYNA
jgi:endonuclease III related protein